VAENLLGAFDASDDDQVRAIVKKSVVFRFLDHQVTKLARQLDPLQGSVLSPPPSSTTAAAAVPPYAAKEPVHHSPSAAAESASGASASQALFQVNAPQPIKKEHQAVKQDVDSVHDTKEVQQAPSVASNNNNNSNNNDSSNSNSSNVQDEATSLGAAVGAEQPHAEVDAVAVAVEGVSVNDGEEEEEEEEEGDSMEAMLQAARQAALDAARLEEQNDHQDDMDFLK
jgi:hypothetical protein